MASQLLALITSYINEGMNVQLKPGKYVLAVSGGVDSVVLLDLLSNVLGLELAVAHFDHGIRQNSKADRIFVGQLSAKYGWPFFYEEGRLGAGCSEARARTARYKFLYKVKSQANAQAIITAHHQDDMIETAIINLLRGTKVRGLSSLKSTAEIVRPLLDLTKQEIIKYARKQNLSWREDETNLDQKYLRNYVRHKLIPKMSKTQKQKLLKIIKTSAAASEEIAKVTRVLIPSNDGLKRSDFISLPYSVGCELLAGWLRASSLKVDKKTIERLAVGLKVAKNGSRLDINKNFQFLVEKEVIKIQKSGQNPGVISLFSF